MSDILWQAVIAGAVSIFLGVLNYRSLLEARKAAAKVEGVKQTLERNTVEQTTKLDQIAAVGEQTHRLCNSAMQAQKKLLAETARAKADITHDRVDVTAADLAERAYAEHDQ